MLRRWLEAKLEQLRRKYGKSVVIGNVGDNTSGFTLMEMLIVIALIGLMATVVGVNVIRRFDQAKVDSTKIQMKQLMVILDDFRRVCGFYPTTDQGLEALAHKPEGRECKNYDPEGFVKKVPKDAWDHDFFFTSDGNKYILKSLGQDGQEGGEGLAADLSSDDLQ
jgi:general secretion pathway protein G